jgi:hypothetical protein
VGPLSKAQYERERQIAILKIVGMLIVLLLVLTLSIKLCMASESELSFNWNAPREVYAGKIDRFLVRWFDKCNPQKLKSARSVVPVLLDVAESEGVNPTIIASIISHESSWQPGALGKLGEIGLMQVNNKVIGSDPADQLRAGILMLKSAHVKCGSIAGAISLYATGKSCKVYRGAKLRIRMAQQIESM